MRFGTLLKQLDSSLYQQYTYESYTEDRPKTFEETVFFPPMRGFEIESSEHSLSSVAVSLDQCSDDNEAVQYCLGRKIPREKFSSLYYIEHAKDISKISPEKYSTLKSEEPRLAIPFYDENGRLTGVSMRALRGESLRYINVKMFEDAGTMFGLNTVDLEKDVYVTEGPIDSLFLDNAIAVGGTGFAKIELLDAPKERFILIFDNESRNKEVCKVMSRFVDLGYRMCIWPCDVREKDINEMVMNGLDPKLLVEANTYKGLMVLAKFTEWKHC